MFDFIRTHRRLMQLILLVLIVPPFTFFGIDGYMRFTQDEQTIATVGKQKITQQELNAAQHDQIQRMQQMFGGTVDPQLLDTPEIRKQTLEALITQKLLDHQVAQDHLVTTDETLRQNIAAIPALQENGQFSAQRYQTILAAQGMSTAQFEARARQELTVQQISTLFQETAWVPKTVVAQVSGLLDQQREIRELLLQSADYVSQVKLTPETLQQYYQQHSKEFVTPEHVNIEYVELSAASLLRQITVSPTALQEYYEQNKKRFVVEELRRASHILFAVPKDAKEAEQNKIRAQAEQIFAQVKVHPADFAKLAKQYSSDSGSAQKGGDLDYFGRGAMVPAFEEAVFKMKPGEISPLVKSDYGFHIILLTDIKPAVTQSLAEVQTQIEAEIKKQLAAKKFAEVAEVFANTIYEQADSLKPVADKLHLQVQTAERLQRTPSDAVKNPLFKNPKLLAALFSDEVLKNKRNSEAIEVAPNKLIAVRVTQYTPAMQRPFDQVVDTIRRQMTQSEARRLARQAGQAKLAELSKNKSLVGFAPAQIVGRDPTEKMSSIALEQIFRVDMTKLPTYIGVELPAAYAIYRVERIVPAKPADASQQASLSQDLARRLGDLEFKSYLQNLRQHVDVQIKKLP